MPVDYSPLPSLPCPKCARNASLQTWVARQTLVPRRDELTAEYRCEDGHVARVVVTDGEPSPTGGRAA